MPIKPMKEMLTEWKNWVLLLLSVVTTFAAVKTQVNDWIVIGVAKANEPAFMIIESGIKKQLEKMSKDPDDVKSTDLELYTKFCENEQFLTVYLENSPNKRVITVGCNEILRMYDETFKL